MRRPAARWMQVSRVGALFLSAGLVWATTSVAQTAPQSAHERGTALYERTCAFCHGSDGQGDTPAGR